MDLKPRVSVLNSYVRHWDRVPNFSVTYHTPEENCVRIHAVSQSQGNIRPCHLLPVEGLHGCEGGALAGVQLVARDQGGGQAQDEGQQRRHGGDRGEM